MRARPRNGFTLIEMLVVLVVLGLVMGLVIGRGPQASATTRLRAAAADIARTLREARGQAIGQDRPVRVAFDTQRRQMALDGGPVRALPPQLGLTVSGTGNVIRFAPDGSASGGTVVVGNAGQRIAVAVEWLTGRVSVHDVPSP